MVEYRNGMTVRELKDLVSQWKDTDDNGEPFEVWIETDAGLSSPCTEVCRLNRGDIILGRWPVLRR
jgi:hypothetical protein